jgi:hypothetical protein
MGSASALAHGISLHLFSRFSAMRRVHPMSGGIGRVMRDTNRDYIDLRRRRFGFDQVPLPSSLQLSADDLALNNSARLS